MVCTRFKEAWKGEVWLESLDSGSMMYAACDAHMTGGSVGTGRPNAAQVADISDMALQKSQPHIKNLFTWVKAMRLALIYCHFASPIAPAFHHRYPNSTLRHVPDRS